MTDSESLEIGKHAVDSYTEKLSKFTFKKSFNDWIKHMFSSNYTDSKTEFRLLSALPFFPESDGKRIAKLINTKTKKGAYIHELFIENIEKDSSKDADSKVKDIVLVHGYGAALGFFIDNYDSLSSLPGIKIHAIDMPGFGLSTREKFPNFPSSTVEEVKRVEDWYIDSIEEWRKNRNIKSFILIGHSFGAYLSGVYALKYNKVVSCEDGPKSLIDKLILVSPPGLERNKFSLLKTIPPQASISTTQRDRENHENTEHNLSRELTDSHEKIVQQEVPQKKRTAYEEKSFRYKLFMYLWRHNYSPLGIFRFAGPWRSSILSGWSTSKLSHVYARDPQQFANMHDYIYRISNAKGSGEYGIMRILDVGAVPKLPLLDRCPEIYASMKLPTLWMYGESDWIDERNGYEMMKEINKLSQKLYSENLAKHKIIPKAGHHPYLDNPVDFTKEIHKFIEAN